MLVQIFIGFSFLQFFLCVQWVRHLDDGSVKFIEGTILCMCCILSEFMVCDLVTYIRMP